MPTTKLSSSTHLLSREKVFFGSHMFYWSENEHTMTQQKNVGFHYFFSCFSLLGHGIKRRMVPRWVLDFQCFFCNLTLAQGKMLDLNTNFTKNTFGRGIGNIHNCKLKWMSCKRKTWRFQNGVAVASGKTKATLVFSYKRWLTMVIFFCPDKWFLHVHLSLFLFVLKSWKETSKIIW